MKNAVSNTLFILFSSLWIIFVLLDYLNKHPNHILSFQYYRFGNYTMAIGAILAATAALYYFVKGSRRILSSGAFVLGLFMLNILMLCLSNSKYINTSADSSNYLFAVGRSAGFLLMTTFIFTAMHAAGSLVFKYIVKEERLQIDLLKICVGCIICITYMIILGAVGFLSPFILWPLLLIPVVLNYKGTFTFIKKLFITPFFETERKNTIAYVLFFILIVFLTINIFSAQSPFPFGFDSRNFYVNISRLVGESGELVRGFPPYAWSLFMSLGYLLIDSPEVTHNLSSTACVLALLYVYRICRKYFDFSAAEALLIMVVFVVTPAVFNQLYAELKIDFGLLFFQLAVLDLIFLYIRRREKVKDRELSAVKDIWKFEKGTIMIVMIGIISGYAISIKFTHLFFLFAVIIGFWTYFSSIRGFLCSFFLCFGFVLLLRLDDISGLRYYHLGASTLSYVLLVIGLIIMALLFKSDKSGLFRSIRASAIIAILSVIGIFPWIIKNYSETPTLSPTQLLLGTPPGPDLNLEKMNQNYQLYKQGRK